MFSNITAAAETVLTRARRHPKGTYIALVALLFAWMSVGMFPLMCYESDSMHSIAGCAVLYNQGMKFPPDYAYFFDMQPLIVYSVALLRRVFGFFSCEQIFCLLTSLSCFAAVAGTLRLCRLMSGTGGVLVLLALFFFPESYACGMYPNSSTPAFALYVWALCLLACGRKLPAAALLSVAPLFRIDIVIVYPAILPLLMLRGLSFRRAFALSAVYALVVVTVVAAACAALGADPIGNTLNTYSEFSSGGQYAKQTVVAIATFYTPVNMILVPVGVLALWRRRSFKLLATCLLPMLLLHFMFRRTGCAGKHWLYILPFAVCLASVGWQAVGSLRHTCRPLFAAVVGLTVFYLFFGIRFSLPGSMAKISKSFITLDSSDGPFLPLAAESATPLRLRVGLGTGQLIPTADECMLLTGNALYPVFIHNYKAHKERIRREARRVAQGLGQYHLFAMEWGGRMFYPNLLIDEEGLLFSEINGSDRLYELAAGADTITCFYSRQDILWNDCVAMERIAGRLKASGRPVLIVPETESRAFLLDKLAARGVVEKRGERCYVVMPERRLSNPNP